MSHIKSYDTPCEFQSTVLYYKIHHDNCTSFSLDQLPSTELATWCEINCVELTLQWVEYILYTTVSEQVVKRLQTNI